jgi:Glyoxalase-like domain
MAAFWISLLGYETALSHTSSIRITGPDGQGPSLLFAPGRSAKTEKNIIHLDLRPDDQAAAVDHALELGATKVDIGQTGDESWIVLADPEGNEFCLLQSLASYTAFLSADPARPTP